MAIYCNDECKDTGGICDFCIYYQDANDGTNKGFAGEGLCTKKDIKVDACDGCDDDFHCTLVEVETTKDSESPKLNELFEGYDGEFKQEEFEWGEDVGLERFWESNFKQELEEEMEAHKEILEGLAGRD